jgi:hypothetical protein
MRNDAPSIVGRSRPEIDHRTLQPTKALPIPKYVPNTMCVCFVMSAVGKTTSESFNSVENRQAFASKGNTTISPFGFFYVSEYFKTFLENSNANNSAHIARGQTSEKLLRSLFVFFGCCGQNVISKNNSKHWQRRSGDHTMFFFCHWMARNWRDLKLHLLLSACCNS